MRRYYVESRDPELIARCKDRLKGTAALKEDEDDSSFKPMPKHHDDRVDDDEKKEGKIASIGEFGAAQ
jgi:hypothetical protein